MKNITTTAPEMYDNIWSIKYVLGTTRGQLMILGGSHLEIQIDTNEGQIWNYLFCHHAIFGKTKVAYAEIYQNVRRIRGIECDI